MELTEHAAAAIPWRADGALWSCCGRVAFLLRLTCCFPAAACRGCWCDGEALFCSEELCCASCCASPHLPSDPFGVALQIERDTHGQPLMLGHGRAAAVCLGRLGDKAVAVKVRMACMACCAACCLLQEVRCWAAMPARQTCLPMLPLQR